MLYIFQNEGEVVGAVDGPVMDMESAFKTWEAENINPGPRPKEYGDTLQAWYANRKDLIEKLCEKYGSIPQQGLAALWMRVLVKDFKYVPRKEFEVFDR